MAGAGYAPHVCGHGRGAEASCQAGQRAGCRKRLMHRGRGGPTGAAQGRSAPGAAPSRRAGGRAMYVPDVVVYADVQEERLTKTYHRKWHATNGRFNSLMRLGELVGSNGQILENLPATVKLFDAPGFLYRELMSECVRWLLAIARRSESQSFKHENRVRYLIGYISNRYEHEFATRKRSHLVEVGSFIKAILHKKIHSNAARFRRRN